MEDIRTDKENIQAIILRQMANIREIRFEMTRQFPKSDAVKMLIVGEGVNWDATFLGFCIINELLPESIRDITIIDLAKSGEVTFFDELSFEGLEDLKVTAEIGDATNFSYASEEFDLIVSPLMIDDCNDHLKLLSELIRCTRTNGTIMVSGHGLDSSTTLKDVPGILGAGHPYQTSPSEISALLTQFEIEDLRIWENDHCWLMVFTKK